MNFQFKFEIGQKVFFAASTENFKSGIIISRSFRYSEGEEEGDETSFTIYFVRSCQHRGIERWELEEDQMFPSLRALEETVLSVEDEDQAHS